MVVCLKRCLFIFLIGMVSLDASSRPVPSLLDSGETALASGTPTAPRVRLGGRSQGEWTRGAPHSPTSATKQGAVFRPWTLFLLRRTPLKQLNEGLLVEIH